MSGDGEDRRVGAQGVTNDLGIPGLTALERIATGGASVVYRAQDTRHTRTVAVKVLAAGRISADAERALERELAAMGRLSTHPNIIDLYDSGTTKDRHPYIVMPYYQRGNYADWVDDNGPLTWQELVDFGIKIAGALHTAHSRGFVHRDIKPANIFRGEFDRQPILADFGIASFAAPGLGGSMTVKVSTTPLYGAPEVLEGERPDERSDIYSFGATLFALVEGTAAFADPSTETVVYRVTAARAAPRPTTEMPEALVELLGDMMSRSPSERPAGCLDVARRFVAIQKDHGLDPTPIVGDGVETDPVIASAGAVVAPRADSTASRAVAEFDDDEAPRPRAGPVIEPLHPGVGLAGGALAGQATRPVGGLDRPTEPVDTDLKPMVPRRGSPLRRRPSLGWAVAAAAVLIVGLIGYAAFFGSGVTPGEIIGPDGDEGDDGRASAMLAAWAAVDLPTTTLDAHPSSWVTDVEFAPGGDGLVTAGTDGRAVVWSLAAADGPSSVFEFDDWVIDTAWSTGGDDIAVAVTNGSVAIAPGDGDGEAAELHSDGAASAEAVAWDPAGERLLVGYSAGAIVIHEVDNSAEDVLSGHDGDVLDVDWSPDGRWALSSAKDGRVTVWDVASGTSLVVMDNPDGRWTRSVEWVTAITFLTSDEDGTVTLRSLEFAGSEGGADDSVEVAEDASMDIGGGVLDTDLYVDANVLLAAGYEDGSVRVWDLVTGDELADLSTTSVDRGDATAVSWSSDGRSMAAGRLDGSVKIWSLD